MLSAHPDDRSRPATEEVIEPVRPAPQTNANLAADPVATVDTPGAVKSAAGWSALLSKKDWPTSLAPFSYGLFASVWLSSLVSNLGGQVQSVGAAWLVTSLTKRPDVVALVTAASLLPILLLSLWAGAIADRYDIRKVLLIAQFVMFAASAALAVVTGLHLITPASLLALTFIIGCGFALNAPAWQASVRLLVPEHDLPNAISLNIVGFNLSRTAGPALGGVVVALAGPQGAFVMNAVSYFGLFAVLLVWMRRPSSQERHHGTMAAAIAAGIRHVALSRPLRSVTLRSTIFGLLLGALFALIPLVVRHRLHGSPADLGLVLGSSGAGAVLGAVAATRLRNLLGVERTLMVATLGTALAMAVVGISRWLDATAAAEMLTGFASTLAFTTFNITLQLRIPGNFAGRAVSIYQMGVFGGLAIGAGAWGAVATLVGLQTALLTAAALMCVSVAIARILPISDN